MSINRFSDDPKVTSLLSIAQEIADSHYETEAKKIVLTQIEKYAIDYLMKELPEGQSQKWYSDKLDDYLLNLLQKIGR
jgi:hypothetical protein